MSTVVHPPVAALPTKDAARVAEPRSLHCFSVDVEEYFHAEAFHGVVARESWSARAGRAEPYVEKLAEALDATNSRATFFVLGLVAERMAPLLRRLSARGHEIACHGYAHDHLSRMTPAELRADLGRARRLLEDQIGQRVRGYRAPTFSVTKRTAWAVDIIVESGFTYDSSVFPIRHDRYGVPAAPVTPFVLRSPSGAEIVSFPPLTQATPLGRVPLGGGGYLRLLPAQLLRAALVRAARAGDPTMLYVHPWELDPDQPRLPLKPLAQWRHRVNLRRTAQKLDYLFARTRFDTAANILAPLRHHGSLPTFTLG